MSKASSSSRMLDRDAIRGPAWDVTWVLLSTLRRPLCISRWTASESLRRMLFALACFRKSAVVVAVSGGLGGGRGGVGATRAGGGGTVKGSLPAGILVASLSVVPVLMVDFLFSESSRA